MRFLRKITKVLFLVVVLFSVSGKLSAQYAVGDFGSTSSGGWSTAGTWSTWNGSAWVGAGASGTPTSTDNVFVLTGTVVLFGASGSPCLNLVVEAGAQLWTNSGTNCFLYVYGTSIVCDGIIGNGAIFDGLSFGIEGANCTISGTGTFDASRMRKNTPLAPTTNLTIARDVNLRWNAASTTQLYNATNNTNFNITINVGATVSLIPNGPNTGNVCIDGLDGTAVALSAGGTFTINGTLSVSGKMIITTNNTLPAYSCNWIINGLVKVNEIVASASGTAGHSLIINAGGKLDITGMPAFSALSMTNNSYSYNINSTVEYSAIGAQQVRVKSEFGSTAFQEYGHLILSGSGLKSSWADVFVKNNFTITGTAVLDPFPVTANIYIGGNWVNYNETGFLEKTTTVYINGTALQTITCPGGEVYNNLRYAKPGSFLQFLSPVDVVQQLIYANNGYIDLNSNALTIRNSTPSGISGFNLNRYILSEKTDNSSKIIWKINASLGTYTFPFGVTPGGAANYIPVIVSKTNFIPIGDVTISTYGTGPDNLPWPVTPTNVTNLWADNPIYNTPDNQHWTVDRFWEIRSSTPTTLGSLTFTYRAIELPDMDLVPTHMGAQYWNIPISYWNRTQYGTSAAYTVNVAAFSIFNTAWTITSLTSPLPIELLSFDAVPQNDVVKLLWKTATEINNDFFTLEKSLDGKEFFAIGNVDGANNSTTERDYSFDDKHPVYGISYYRLKQTDYDGLFSYSDVVPVKFGKHNKEFRVFPNPATENAYLIADSGGNTEVKVRNAEGQLISTYEMSGTSSVLKLELSTLSMGIYILEIKSDYETQYLRLIKK